VIFSSNCASAFSMTIFLLPIYPVFSYPLSPFFFLASLPDHQPRDSRLFAMFPPVSQTDPDSVHRPRATLRAPQLSALQRFFAGASGVEIPPAHARRVG